MVSLESRKAVSLSIKTVLILMVGALVVLGVMGSWGAFESSTDDSIGESTQQADQQSSEAACILECRQENLGGGGDYEGCVQSC